MNAKHISVLLFLAATALALPGQAQQSVAKWRDSTGNVVQERPVTFYGPHNSIGRRQFKVDGKFGLVDLDGLVIADAMYDRFYFNADSLPFVYERDSLMGYIDTRTGREITPPLFKTAGPFHQNRAAVSFDGHKVGYVDTTGQVVIAPQWDLVSGFYQNMAKVIIANDLSAMFVRDIPHNIQIATPGKTGFIDRNGAYIIPPEYSYIDINRDEPYLRFNRGVYDPAGANSPDFRKAYPNCKWGLMDLQGKIVLPDTEYDYIFLLFGNGRDYYGVEKAGTYGVLDPVSLKLIVPLGTYASDEELEIKIQEITALH